MRVHNFGYVPREALPTLFEPFQRMAAQTTSAAGKAGLGLGLFIAREIARAHGGDVSVQSSDERTTFEVTLPRNARRADAAALTTT